MTALTYVSTPELDRAEAMVRSISTELLSEMLDVSLMPGLLTGEAGQPTWLASAMILRELTRREAGR